MFQQLISTWIPLGTALLRQLFPRFGAAPCHYINGPDTLPAPGPEEGQELEELYSLPPEDRAVIHLHYYEGYTLEEIAGFLHISPSAVSMRLHRARKLLRSSLEDDYGSENLPKNVSSTPYAGR